jgi:CRP-like cAMP-binding protein
MLKRKLIDRLDSLRQLSRGYRSFLEEDHSYRYRLITRGLLLLSPGKKANELHFIGKGLFKLYYQRDSGEEQLLDFFTEGDFMMLPVDFYDNTDNFRYYIKALEPGEILSIYKRDMDLIYKRFPEARDHTDLIRSEISLSITAHVDLLLIRKEERFNECVKVKKEVCPRISKQLMSNFLGISKRSLERGRSDHKR